MAIMGYSAFPKAPQSNITEATPPNFLMSYQDTRLGESYLYAEMLSVYSTSPVDWGNEEKGRKDGFFLFPRKKHLYLHVSIKQSKM